VSRLTRNELIACLGGLALAVGIFIKWYEAVSDLAELGGVAGRSTQSAWDVHDIMRWVLLLAAIAPFVLAYIIVRGHSLSWARGEMTAVLAVAAFGLVFYNGIIDRPGEPSGEIELEWGWYVALAGTIAMFFGSALRSSETERGRKPPGVL
jgi:hypothetical protein